jgi:uncharacterized protein YfaS (alpha-2-macroglobulin family)
MREFIDAGVAKILRHQADSGAFSLWPGGQPENHLTALALYALAQAKQAGYEVPNEPVERALRSLREAVTSGRLAAPYHQEIAGESGSHAFALYVLAVWKRPENGTAAKLFASRAGLPRYGKAFLLRALALGGGDPQAQKVLLAEITEGSAKKGDGVLLPEPLGDKLAFYLSSDVRSSALVLQTLLESAPQNELVDPLVRGLLASRDRGRWANTEDNFYSLTSLSAYAQKRASADIPLEVSLGGHELVHGRLPARSLRRVTLPLAEARGTLAVRAEGQPVYYAARLRYTPRRETVTPFQNGFEIRREVLDPKTDQPIGSFKVGEAVRIRLTVTTAAERTRVALVDRLPAGLEVVDARLGHHEEEQESRRWSSFSYIEAHDDRVQAFSDVMWPGTHQFEYLARATTAETFTRPPATVEEMYKPEVAARTALEEVTVQP